MLDQVQWLGVDAIWLMPISPSPSDHKYDVTNYCSVDKHYGTQRDFSRFVHECHARGIKVIIDFVANHTSSQHPWFVNSANDPNGKYSQYYNWKDTLPDGLPEDIRSRWHKHPNGRYYYANFWAGMPDLNYDNTAVRSEMKKAAAFWIKQGVDGFRLDAAKYIYSAGEGSCPNQQIALQKNLAWWSEFRNYCRKLKPDVIMIAEIWDTPETRAAYATVFDRLFHFDLGGWPDSQVFSVVMRKSDPSAWARSMQQYYSLLSGKKPGFCDVPFICNHDMDRAASILPSMEELKMAASIYLTLPGTPQIYYGEEIGMKGHRASTDNDDNSRRSPMLWGENVTGQTSWIPSPDSKDTQPFFVQKNAPQSLLNHYRQLIHIRKSTKALSVGNFKVVETNSKNLLAYLRRTPKETVLVLHRLGPGPMQIDECKNFTKPIFKWGCYNGGSTTQMGSLIMVKQN